MKGLLSSFRPIHLLRLPAFALLALPLTPVFDRPPFIPPEYVLVLDDSPSMDARLPGFAERSLAAWKEFDDGRGPVVTVGERPLPPSVSPRTRVRRR